MMQLMLALSRLSLPLPRCYCCHLVNVPSTARQSYNIPGKSVGGLLGIVTIITPEPLADFQQLRLDVLRVQGAQLGPDSPIQEDQGLVPSPDGGGNRRLSCECGGGGVALLRVGLCKDVAWQNVVVVRLESVRPGHVVVWRDGRRQLVDVRSEGLIVFGLGESLVLGQLWLQILFPFLLTERLGLGDARGSVLGGISPGRRQDSLVDRLVVRSRELDVRSSVCVVIRLDMGRYSVLKLEVGFADPGRGIGAFFECGWTSEENAQDRVPGEKPAMASQSAIDFSR